MATEEVLLTAMETGEVTEDEDLEAILLETLLKERVIHLHVVAQKLPAVQGNPVSHSSP